ncbi:MAG: recombinase family protein [Oscillospiraceae bacterium]|jgi:site-specific DNA recombinase|nr:recombinase family protein [Oscillospiraceae bacterium]
MLRAAAYCRVSTDKEDQANSFESQQRFFHTYIEQNPDWELVEVFADEGISGTSTKKRTEFNRMIQYAKAGCLDLIITKEVSRFARNTVDTLQYTRDLKRLGVYVLFLNDNIHTKDPDGELRLTIMASIAQEESRKTSERVKWGQKRKMEQGFVFGHHMLGYDVRDGKLSINEKGAQAVRLIFHKFLEEGKGTYTIARELREDGIEPSVYMKKWSNIAVLRILQNEKYCGDLIQKKTYTPDYLNHEAKRNRGQEEYVILRSHHEPIISREQFERAQKELERRSPSPEERAKHSNRYCLSGKIQCGCCGARFVARTKHRKDGSQCKAWRCFEATQHGASKVDKAGNHIGCDINYQIRDEDFMLMLQTIVKQLQCNQERLISNLTETVRTVLSTFESRDMDADKWEQKLTAVTQKKERLLDLYLGGELSKSEYHRMSERYDTEMENLQQQLQKANKRKSIQANQKELLADISDPIRGLMLGEKQDDTFYRNLVDRIVVYSRERIEVYLNLIPGKWNYMLAELPIRSNDGLHSSMEHIADLSPPKALAEKAAQGEGEPS